MSDIHPYRAGWVWGGPALEVIHSLKPITPDCYKPEGPNIAYMIDPEVESSIPMILLLKAIEEFPIVAQAVVLYGAPTLLNIRDLTPRIEEPSGKEIRH